MIPDTYHVDINPYREKLKSIIPVLQNNDNLSHITLKFEECNGYFIDEGSALSDISELSCQKWDKKHIEVYYNNHSIARLMQVPNDPFIVIKFVWKSELDEMVAIHPISVSDILSEEQAPEQA
jgi:hypothetical protein